MPTGANLPLPSNGEREKRPVLDHSIDQKLGNVPKMGAGVRN